MPGVVAVRERDGERVVGPADGAKRRTSAVAKRPRPRSVTTTRVHVGYEGPTRAIEVCAVRIRRWRGTSCGRRHVSEDLRAPDECLIRICIRRS